MSLYKFKKIQQFEYALRIARDPLVHITDSGKNLVTRRKKKQMV